VTIIRFYFYRYFGAPLKMRASICMYICMYICICIYVYICTSRSDPMFRSDPIRCPDSEAEQLFGIQPTSRFEAKKKGSSKAPLFPPTILTTFCRRQPSRCFLVYLDSSSLPPVLSFNLFPVTLPIGSVFLLG